MNINSATQFEYSYKIRKTNGKSGKILMEIYECTAAEKKVNKSINWELFRR